MRNMQKKSHIDNASVTIRKQCLNNYKVSVICFDR